MSRTGKAVKRGEAPPVGGVVVRRFAGFVVPASMSAALIPVGAFEYACMIFVAELGKDAFLKKVHRRLQETVGAFENRVISAGQASGAMRALARRGFLTKAVEENRSGRGAPVIVYTITPAGDRLMRLASAACAFANDETFADEYEYGDSHVRSSEVAFTSEATVRSPAVKSPAGSGGRRR